MKDQFQEAHHQHVLARVGDYSASFGLHGINQTIGRRDKTVVVQVVAAGPGNVSRGTRNECTIKPGQMALVNLYHRTHEFTLVGENLSTFNWENIMATIEIDAEKKAVSMAPLQAFIVTKKNERRAQYVMMGKGLIINPNGDSQSTGGSAFNESGKRVEQIKVACEEVVSVGPGAVVDGLWQPPTVKPGAMVLYDTSTTPVSFMAGGHSFTLVHWRSVMCSFDGDDEETRSTPS